MGSSGFSSPRSECFPAGLRVLVVDDDPTWLKILEKMLKKCNYEVTTCNLAREALDLLRGRKDGFDIVISDVNMPDMDGFKLLEHVGLEMDLPVIMMSVDGETSRVMKGVQHGACDYLLKPIRMKELKNIWQHVFRKKIHEVRDIEGYENLEEIHMLRNGNETSDDGFMFSGDLSLGKKRKGSYNKNDDMACDDFSSIKKSRVVWTVDLHQKFVRAVNHIGFDKVGPKKILDIMGVSWLTRENVASHLQKYRLYLSRLQNENELKPSFGSINHSDIPSKGSSPANHCTQKSVPSENYETYVAPVHKIPTHKDVSKICEGNSKGVILSIPMIESKKSLFGDVIDPPQTNISFSHSFGRADLKTQPNSQGQYPWSAESPSIRFKQEKIPHFQSNHSFDHLHDVHVNSMQPSRKEADKPIVASITPSYGKGQTRSIGTVTKVKNTAALFSFQPQSKEFEQQIPCSLEQNLFEEFGTGSGFRLWDEEFNSFSSQGDFHSLNDDIEPFRFGNKEIVISDVPQYLYDSLSFEYQNEPVEYQVIDQGLFIA